MHKRFAIIGLGRFGSSVAMVLQGMGQRVLAVDSNLERVDALATVIPRVVQADATDIGALRALDIASYDAVVIAMGDNVEASVIACINCLDLGVTKIVAKAQDEAHGRVLERMGVHRVVHPQRDMGIRVAHNLSAGGIIDFVRLSEEYGIAEVEASAALVGHSLQELDMRNRYGLNVMVIKRGDELIVSPSAEERFEADDRLVVIGETAGINRLQGG